MYYGYDYKGNGKEKQEKTAQYYTYHISKTI